MSQYDELDEVPGTSIVAGNLELWIIGAGMVKSLRHGDQSILYVSSAHSPPEMAIIQRGALQNSKHSALTRPGDPSTSWVGRLFVNITVSTIKRLNYYQYKRYISYLFC